MSDHGRHKRDVLARGSVAVRGPRGTAGEEGAGEGGGEEEVATTANGRSVDTAGALFGGGERWHAVHYTRTAAEEVNATRR